MTSATQARLAASLRDRYTVEREIGRGGMATVFLARDLKHQREVALKVLLPDVADTIGAERFQAEIHHAAQLTHPHLVPVFDSGNADGLLYYVMPYLDGETLRARLDREGALDIDEVRRLTAEVADGLAYAHQRGLVHRDIKPENILLADGHATVADFGIARTLSVTGEDRLTRTGILIGTPAYMSPEQAAGDPELDERSDVYSLGCVVFEMLTGEAPLIGPSSAATLARRIAEVAPDVTDLRPDVPSAIAHAVSKAMARDSEERFADARSFAQALSASGTTVPAPRQRTIAILPFRTLGTDTGDEYFSDGLTEELIADLARLKSLRVTSRASTMALKGTIDTPRVIGRKLGVRYLLEGSLRRSGTALRITATLIDTSDDSHLWAEKFSGSVEDVFDVQERVAREIARSLDVALSPDENRHLAARPISDVRVLDTYLRARHELYRVSPESIKEGERLVRQGLDLDPDNPRLLSLLLALQAAASAFHTGIDDARLRASEALLTDLVARHASVPELYQAIGVVRMELGDLAAAAGSFARAVELDPSFGDAIRYRSLMFQFAGYNREARDEITRALALDPLSSYSWSYAGTAAWFDGRFHEAVSLTQRGVDVDPHNFLDRWIHGYACVLLGHYGDAQSESEWLNKASPQSPYSLQLAGLLQGLAGDHTTARATLSSIPVDRLNAHEMLHVAESLTAAGDTEGGLALLERAVVRGFYPLEFIRTHNPLFAPLRGDPRFGRIVELAVQKHRAFRALSATA